MWGASMPCGLPSEHDIPLGRYGTSNVGIAKTVYRTGLAYRFRGWCGGFLMCGSRGSKCFRSESSHVDYRSSLACTCACVVRASSHDRIAAGSKRSCRRPILVKGISRA